MVGYHQEIVPQRNSMKLHSFFIRNRQLNSLLELFLVASVSSVLVIRFALALSGYPQVGGRELHIAHLLWGGLFMLVALVLLLTFLGRRIRILAVLLGGIGFGTFVDFYIQQLGALDELAINLLLLAGLDTIMHHTHHDLQQNKVK